MGGMLRLWLITCVALFAFGCDDENVSDGNLDGGGSGEFLDGEVDAIRDDAAVLPDASLPDARPDRPTPDAALPDAALPDGALPDAARPDALTPDAGPPGPPQLHRGRLQWTAGPAGRGSAPMRFSGHGLRVEGRLRP